MRVPFAREHTGNRREYLKTFEQFPPRQKPASFSIDDALEKARRQQADMARAIGGGVK